MPANMHPRGQTTRPWKHQAKNGPPRSHGLLLPVSNGAGRVWPPILRRSLHPPTHPHLHPTTTLRTRSTLAAASAYCWSRPSRSASALRSSSRIRRCTSRALRRGVGAKEKNGQGRRHFFSCFRPWPCQQPRQRSSIGGRERSRVASRLSDSGAPPLTRSLNSHSDLLRLAASAS